MSPEAYRLAGELFERLNEVSSERQKAELDLACPDDPELCEYVAGLLDADRSAPESFLASPAAEHAIQVIAQRAVLDAPAPGTRFGNYVIGRRIGSGGMGTVYEADDTRLNRRVAVKILPPAFIDDKDRIRRFRQEARLTSRLNHPNIVSIYDAELERGRCYIATELVEGKTLRQLAEEHPFDRGLFLDIAMQICSALADAHRAGVVHRDIKPENVMVRPDGIVKVLDFGLATLTEGAHGGDAGGASSRESRTRGVAGTLAYLSPEQVQGKPATPQSDIFSLGVTLYELAAGVRPFTGPSDTVVIAAILQNLPPAPSSVRQTLGPEIDAIILRAIEKDPELRFQTAADLRAAFKLVARGSRTDVQPASRAGWVSRRVGWSRSLAVLCGITFAAITLAFGLLRLRFSATDPLPHAFTRLTDGTAEEVFPRLTPDGKQFLYASTARGKWGIYLRRVGGSATTDLTAGSTSDDTEPALSRDGSRIAFRSERDGGGIFVMESTGENPVRVSPVGYLPAWSPDGKSIVFSDQTFSAPGERGAPASRLHVLDLASGARRDLRTGDAMQPSWSPHGFRIAYWGLTGASQRNVWTVGADGTNPVAVTMDAAVDWNPVWSAAGDTLYFISDRGGSMNVWRVAIDEATGKTRRAPEPVTVPAEYVKYLSWSADGKELAYAQSQKRDNLYSVPFEKSRMETLGDPVPIYPVGNNIVNFSLSPDGSKIVYDTIGDSREDIWISDTNGLGRRRLVGDGLNRTPQWSPEGDEIAFFSNRGGSYDEWLVRADGSGLRQVTKVSPGAPQIQVSIWLNKGILASRQWGGPSFLDARAERPITNPEPLPGFPARRTFQLSAPPRDGVLLGYFEGTAESLAQYDLRTHRLEPLGIDGASPVWVPGSRSKFVFRRRHDCYLYDLDLKKEKHLFSAGPNVIHQVSFDPSGRTLYATERVRDSEIWLAQFE